MNTDNIIKTLKEYNKFDYFIKNLKDYKKKIISEKEIENIDGYNSEIKNIIFAFDDNFKKQLIIAHLELIRDYYVYTNEVIKVKVYNTAIANIKKETDISNLRKIKGVGVGLEKMINELFSKGKIAFIENIIKKDIEFMITRKGNRIKKEDIKNDFNKKTIISTKSLHILMTTKFIKINRHNRSLADLISIKGVVSNQQSPTSLHGMSDCVRNFS